MKDFRGLDIEVGDIIAFPAPRGSDMTLRRGVVIDIVDDTLRVKADGISCLIALSFANRVAVLDKSKWNGDPSFEQFNRVTQI